jgi:hypothetical protein
MLMSEAKLSFSSRLILAFVAFWRTLVDAEFAAGVERISRGGEAAMAPEPPTSAAAEAPAPRLLETDIASALQLLGLLQQEGRFVDFLQEDVAGYTDAEVGGAARVVHEGCKRALSEHLEVTPVRTEEEGTRITLQQGFSPSEVRLTGNVVGEPPFTGTLMHRGWRAQALHLPKLAEGHEVRVLAPAEVEL